MHQKVYPSAQLPRLVDITPLHQPDTAGHRLFHLGEVIFALYLNRQPELIMSSAVTGCPLSTTISTRAKSEHASHPLDRHSDKTILDVCWTCFNISSFLRHNFGCIATVSSTIPEAEEMMGDGFFSATAAGLFRAINVIV